MLTIINLKILSLFLTDIKVKDKLGLCEKDLYYGYNIVCKYLPYDKEEYNKLEKLKIYIFKAHKDNNNPENGSTANNKDKNFIYNKNNNHTIIDKKNYTQKSSKKIVIESQTSGLIN